MGICKICQSSQIKQVSSIPLYSNKGDYDTSISKCENCGVYYRDFNYSDYDKMKTHFSIASYTDISRERMWRANRMDFFQNIVKFSNRYVDLNSQTKVLDFGCSFGHLLEEYRRYGVKCFGIELVDELRHRLATNFADWGIYERFDQIPEDINFDIIALIDSLYCMEDPIETLTQAKSRLNNNGVIIIRITNRVFLLNIICKYFPTKFNREMFGDAKYNYSQKSMNVIFEKVGLKVEKIILHEKGKAVKGIRKKFIYYAPLIINYIIPTVRITPGIIYILKHG